jgi:hypothetical protein
MTVEVKRDPTAAEQELNAGIEKLRAAIDSIPQELRSSLASLHEPLYNLGRAMEDEEPEVLLRSLVALARAVIEIRQRNPGGPLANLPVPPYDLWLPFKADVSRTAEDPASDPYRRAAISARNCKPKDIWAILDSLGFKKGERLDPQPPSRGMEEDRR